MQFKTLFPAALAWSATAILIPTDTSGEALKALSADVSSGTPELQLAVKIPCDGCAVAQEKEDGTYSWDESGARKNDLVVSYTKKDGKIFIGGSVVYPLAQAHGPIIGSQAAEGEQESEVAITTDRLHLATRSESHFVRTLPQDESPGNSPLDINHFIMEILGMEDKVVHVGTIDILVGTSQENGEVIIMGQPTLVPTIASPDDAECETIICRVRTQMAQKLSAAKTAATSAMGKLKAGCKGMLGMHPHPHGQAPHGKGPHHGHHHGKEHANGEVSVHDRIKGGPAKFGKRPCPGRHGIMAKIAHGVMMFTRHVLMPVLVGVAAGMAVSAFGMVIGQLVFMIYSRLRGRRCSNGGYVAVYQVELPEEDLEQQKEDLEPLPVYEAGDHVLPPAYTDEKQESEN